MKKILGENELTKNSKELLKKLTDIYENECVGDIEVMVNLSEVTQNSIDIKTNKQEIRMKYMYFDDDEPQIAVSNILFAKELRGKKLFSKVWCCLYEYAKNKKIDIISFDDITSDKFLKILIQKGGVKKESSVGYNVIMFINNIE